MASAATSRQFSTSDLMPIVLCVDDNHTLRSLYWHVLSVHGYRCIACESADAALEAVRLLPVSVVTLDFDMPGRNGADLARSIRAIRPAMPILLVSGNADLSPEDLTPFDDVCEKGVPNTCFFHRIAELSGRTLADA